MQKIKQFFVCRKGSAMVMAMIVLVNAMLIVVSISLISIAERKMSGKFKTSTPAFQVADSGVEAAIKRIQDNDDPTQKISVAFGNDSEGKFACPNVSNCELMFYSVDDPTNPLGRNDDMGEIYTVRAIGSNGSGQEISSRAIELTMAAASCASGQSSFIVASNNSASFSSTDFSTIKSYLDDGGYILAGYCARTNSGLPYNVQLYPDYGLCNQSQNEFSVTNGSGYIACRSGGDCRSNHGFLESCTNGWKIIGTCN